MKSGFANEWLALISGAWTAVEWKGLAFKGLQELSGPDLSETAAAWAWLTGVPIYRLDWHVYDIQNKPATRPLSTMGLQQLLEAYIAVWMAGDDIISTLGNNKELAQVFPHWDQLLKFVAGQISALDYERSHQASQGARVTGQQLFQKRYSFQDAHAVVGGITNSFASFWESECRAMKQKLVSRVQSSLNDFRETSSNLERASVLGQGELGALDETSARLGKQVIIPNYIQGASNCIVTASHYSICCINECEPIMAEIEEAVKSPMATVEHLRSLVGNMTALNTLEDEVDVVLDDFMVSQLQSIAKEHGGQVPIHGRLFAQWLHYVFPRDCLFPHKSGSAQSLSPNQYGDGYLASDDEMEAHAKDTRAEIPLATMKREELQWMSQWSEDEELFASYDNLAKRGGAGTRTFIVAGSGLFLLAVFIGAVSFNRKANQQFLPVGDGKAAAAAGDPVAKFCMQHAVDYSAENALRALPVELQCKILNEGPLRASNPSAVLMSRIRKAQTLLAEMRRLGKDKMDKYQWMVSSTGRQQCKAERGRRWLTRAPVTAAVSQRICGNGVCFCKALYSGETCEVEFKEEYMRLGYFTVMVILSLSVVVGFFAADILWRVTRPSVKASSLSTQQAGC
eukprot:s3413_g9.t1